MSDVSNLNIYERRGAETYGHDEGERPSPVLWNQKLAEASLSKVIHAIADLRLYAPSFPGEDEDAARERHLTFEGVYTDVFHGVADVCNRGVSFRDLLQGELAFEKYNLPDFGAVGSALLSGGELIKIRPISKKGELAVAFNAFSQVEHFIEAMQALENRRSEDLPSGQWSQLHKNLAFLDLKAALNTVAQEVASRTDLMALLPEDIKTLQPAQVAANKSLVEGVDYNFT